MSEVLDALNAKVAELQASADSANAKADLLIAGNADLRAQVAQLLAQGGASVAELQSVIDNLDSIKASLDQQGTEDDAALNPPANPPTP